MVDNRGIDTKIYERAGERAPGTAEASSGGSARGGAGNASTQGAIDTAGSADAASGSMSSARYGSAEVSDRGAAGPRSRRNQAAKRTRNPRKGRQTSRAAARSTRKGGQGSAHPGASRVFSGGTYSYEEHKDERMAKRHEERMRRVKRRRIMLLVLAFLLVGAVAAHFGLKEWNKKQMEPGHGPTISLKEADEPVEVMYGEHFVDPGYTAKAKNGDDLTDAVKVEIPPMPHSGDYKVTYTVKDEKGRVGKAERNVRVVFPAQTFEGAQHGVPVLMYHYIYDPWNPPANLDANHCTTDALEAQLQYLVTEGYYFPTWEEVRDYVDGKIDLPEKSVVLTFDDGAEIFEKNGIPILEEYGEKYGVESTAFIISGRNGEHWMDLDLKHVQLQSHSHDMHKAGGFIGHGGIFTNLTVEEGAEDLRISSEELGGANVLAYPYGDYTPNCEMAVQEADYILAFTTEHGKVYPGMDPYALPRVRVANSPTGLEYASLL